MRRSACRSKSNSALAPARRPTLTMRPSSAVAFMVCATTGPDSMSTVRLTPLPSVALSTASGHAGSRGVDGEIGAEFLEPRAAGIVGRRADHQLGALELGDLQAHQPDARAGALDHHALAGLQPAGGDERIVQRGERDRERGCLLEAHARGHRIDAAPVADGVFGVAAVARAHDAIAGLEGALHLGAGLDHLARPLDADQRADAAVGAMRQAARDREIGAVERRGLDLHQHLVGLGLRLRDIAHDEPVLARNASLHRFSPVRLMSES